MLISFLTFIGYWILTGIVSFLLHYFVLFRGFDDMLYWYEKSKDENLKKLVMFSKRISKPELIISLFIASILLPPLEVLSFIKDVIRFTFIKG